MARRRRPPLALEPQEYDGATFFDRCVACGRASLSSRWGDLPGDAREYYGDGESTFACMLAPSTERTCLSAGGLRRGYLRWNAHESRSHAFDAGCYTTRSWLWLAPA